MRCICNTEVDLINLGLQMYAFFLPRTSVLSGWVAQKSKASLGVKHQTHYETTESSPCFLSGLLWVPRKPGFPQADTEFHCPIWNRPGLIFLAESSQVQLQFLCLMAGKAGWWKVRVCKKVTAGGISLGPTHFLKQHGKEHILICQHVKCRKQYLSFTVWCVEERKYCLRLSTQKN